MRRHTAVQRVGETETDGRKEVGFDCIVRFYFQHDIQWWMFGTNRNASVSWADLFSAVLIIEWLLSESQIKTCGGKLKQLCRREHTIQTWTLTTEACFTWCRLQVSLFLPLGLSVSSFSSEHNGSTHGHRWGGRPSRLPNVLKVKSSAWCVCVCPVPVAGQIKQLSIIPRWEQTQRQDGSLILLSSPLFLYWN